VDKWIDLHALWQIVALGLVCGAGLPAVFAVGLRALSLPAAGERPVGDDSDRVVGGSIVGMFVAAICFAIVAGAIGWGIYLIVHGS
jgi:hypothetical protein